MAWQVTVFMVLQAMMSFSVFAWLAPILRERGVDGGTAGLIVSASIVLQMLGSLFAPALATRFRDQRAINTVVALMTGGGFALSIFGPAGTPLAVDRAARPGAGQPDRRRADPDHGPHPRRAHRGPPFRA